MTQAWWGARATVGFVALAVALALVAAAPPTQAQDNGEGHGLRSMATEATPGRLVQPARMTPG